MTKRWKYLDVNILNQVNSFAYFIIKMQKNESKMKGFQILVFFLKEIVKLKKKEKRQTSFRRKNKILKFNFCPYLDSLEPTVNYFL